MSTPSRFPEAVYLMQDVPQYRANRWIEALPPIITDQAEVADQMLRLVTTDAAARAAPAQIRAHMVEGIAASFLQPLNQHIGLFSAFSVLLRSGYVQRNPARPEFLRTLLEGASQLALGAATSPPRQNLGPGAGHALIGDSGVGKTTAVEAVLQCYPQVIWHPQLHGALKSVHQIVWLKLSCSHDGSTKELCRMFFEQVDFLLGTDYTGLYCRSGATVNDLRSGMGRVAFLHGLGVLIVDEIQNLNEAKSGGIALMMNFFKLLRDVMKVPMLLVGTDAARNLLGGDIQASRRHVGLPEFEPMQLDGSFQFFLESLFQAQYLRSPIAVTQPLVALLYYLSQGITDLVVQLFVRAQGRALACGVEELSAALFEEVYQDSFGLLHPFLEMKRQGMKVPHGTWDRAMLEARLAAGPDRTPQPGGAVPVVGRPVPAAKAVPAPNGPTSEKQVVGVPKRRKRRTPGRSDCVLVQVVESGGAKELGAHEALSKAGFVRALGAEALAA